MNNVQIESKSMDREAKRREKRLETLEIFRKSSKLLKINNELLSQYPNKQRLKIEEMIFDFESFNTVYVVDKKNRLCFEYEFERNEKHQIIVQETENYTIYIQDFPHEEIRGDKITKVIAPYIHFDCVVKIVTSKVMVNGVFKKEFVDWFLENGVSKVEYFKRWDEYTNNNVFGERKKFYDEAFKRKDKCHMQITYAEYRAEFFGDFSYADKYENLRTKNSNRNKDISNKQTSDIEIIKQAFPNYATKEGVEKIYSYFRDVMNYIEEYEANGYLYRFDVVLNEFFETNKKLNNLLTKLNYYKVIEKELNELIKVSELKQDNNGKWRLK